ncbi:MAG: ABC transporter permease [Acidobacteria bacterium]|nr:ABC transporter permease [Acidobacteriota bacterium]
MNHSLQEIGALTRRWFIHLSREPVHVMFALIQPLLWFALFANIFSRVARGSQFGNVSYPTFMTASALALTVVGNSLMGGIPLLMDKELGFLNKLLAAPISRNSILMSRFLFVNAVNWMQMTIILLVALLMKVHLETGAAGIVLLYLLGALLGIGVTFISLALAFLLHSHAEFFAIVGFINLPLVFVSSALIPVSLMPIWLAWLAKINPLTYAIDGMRAMIIPGWQAQPIWLIFFALVLFDAICFLISARIFRRNLG